MPGTRSKYLVYLLAGLAGGLVMAFELAGSRVLAPYFGTSLVVWTDLIGVVLLSLSAGYYFGGRWADRTDPLAALAWALLWSAISIVFAMAAKDLVLGFLGPDGSLAWKGLIGSLVLFAPASFCLGLVSPLAARAIIVSTETSGQAIGGLYAASTLGSIIGTFAAGFYLVPALGTNRLLLAIALALIASAAVYGRGRRFWVGMALVIVAALALWQWPSPVMLYRGTVQADRDTLYNRFLVVDHLDPKTQRPVRYLISDPWSRQSGMFLDSDDPLDLVFPYTRFFRIAGHFRPDPRRALVIGGGAYSFPRAFLADNPEATLDVVELDPETTALAKDYFQLEDSGRLRALHEDGRRFLNRNREKYDQIYLDAFGAALSTPFQLTTREALERVRASLAEGGVVVANLIGAPAGEKSLFMRSEYATYRAVFRHVYLFPVQASNDSEKVQNVILVATDSEQEAPLVSNDPEFSRYLGNRYEPGPDRPRILTDDWAPVEYFNLSLL